MIEAHIVFDKRMFGPDTPASLTVEDFRLLSEARDAFHEMRSNPVQKNLLAESMAGMRSAFGKSLAPVRDLPAGTVLSADLLTAKKPATGIPAARVEDVAGRKLKRQVSCNRVLHWEDLDE